MSDAMFDPRRCKYYARYAPSGILYISKFNGILLWFKNYFDHFSDKFEGGAGGVFTCFVHV